MHGIIGVVRGTQHAIAVNVQTPALRLDQSLESQGVSGASPRQQGSLGGVGVGGHGRHSDVGSLYDVALGPRSEISLAI